MINDGQVFLAGYVASPPSFKLAGGKPHATVRVAFTPRWISRDTGEWEDGPTSFVNVLCWRALAGNVAVSLRKGEPVLVMGRLRVRRYQDREGAVKIAVEVDAQSIGHDLTRGVAAFSRTRRAAGETAAESAEALMSGAAASRPAVPRGDEQHRPRADQAGDLGETDDRRAGAEPDGAVAAEGAVSADRAGVTYAQEPGEGAVLEDGEDPEGGLDEIVVARLAWEAGEPLDAVAPI